MRSRAEHLAWCKSRAHEIADQGDCEGAVASMASDINKHEETRMDSATLALLSMSVLMGSPDRERVKHWIDGFN